MNYGYFKRSIIFLAFLLGCFFAFNINVKAGTLKANFVRNLAGADEIKEIIFVDNTTVPSGVNQTMDFSVEEDNSIIGYYIQDSVDGQMSLYVGSNSTIVFPSYSAYMFSGLGNLESIQFSNIDTSNVTSMFYMFNETPKLGFLDLSLFDTSNIDPSEEQYAFPETVETIVTPASFNLSLPDGVWEIEGTGQKYINTDIHVTESTTFVRSVYILGIIDSTLYITNHPVNGASENIIYFEGTPLYNYVEDYDFTNVVIGTTDDQVDLVSMYAMFAEMDNIESITFANVSTSNLRNMMGAFYETTNPSFTTIDLSSIDTRNVTASDYLFESSALNTITIGTNWDLPLGEGKWKNSSGEIFNSNQIPTNVADTYTKLLLYWGFNEETETAYISNIERSETYNGVFDEYYGLLDELYDATGSYQLIQSVKHVVVGTSSTDIVKPSSMSYWFYGLQNVEDYNFTYLDTSDVENMASLFSGNSNIETLNLSSFNTANVTNMNSMFYSCESLKNLNVSSFNTSNVTDMRYMFYGCENLTTLNLSNFNTEKVTSMNSMFSGCSNLASVNTSIFNTSLVTDMSYMFSGCSSLTEINVSSFNTTNVKEMDYMFNNCSSLTTLILSNFNTYNLERFSMMFHGMKVESLDLSSFDTSSAMYYSYFLPDDVSSVTVGSNWTIDFYDGLWRDAAGNIYNYDEIPANVAATYYKAVINWGIDKDSKTLYISNKSLSLGSNAIYGYISYDGRIESTNSGYAPWTMGPNYEQYANNIEHVVVGTSQTDIIKPIYMDNWFAYLNYVTSFDFTYLDTSSVISMSRLFYNCANIETLNLSNFNTSKVTNMDAMFSSDYSLSNLNISSFNTSSLKSINSMFEYTNSLENLDISNFDLSKVVLKNDVFYDSGIKQIKVSNTFNNIELPEGDYEDVNSGMIYAYDEIPSNTATTYKMKLLYYSISNGVLRINDYEMLEGVHGSVSARGTNNEWVMGADDITKVVVGSAGHVIKPRETDAWFLNLYNVTEFDLRYLNTSNVTSMIDMFGGCSSIESIDLSNLDLSKVEDMRYMFENAEKLKTVTFGNSVTSSLEDVQGMFYGCTSLENVNFGKFDTSNVTDFSFMFSSCTSLKELDISKFNFASSVDTNWMFYENSKLELLKVSDLSGFKVYSDPSDPSTEAIFEASDKLNILVSKEYNKPVNYEGTDLLILDKDHLPKSGTIRTGDVIKTLNSQDGDLYIDIILLGDTNKDGRIDISDVMKVATHSIKKNSLKTKIEMIAGNVVRNKSKSITDVQDIDINISDVMKIATYSIKGGEL